MRESLDALQWFPRLRRDRDRRRARGGGGARQRGRRCRDAAAAATDRRRATRSATHGLVSILFLSDGAQTRGELEPLEGAQRAKAAGIPVYTVALGTPNGRCLRFGAVGGGGFNGGGGGGGGFGGGFGRAVPPDPQTLRAIADTTGGKFFRRVAPPATSRRDAYAGHSAPQPAPACPTASEITDEFVAGAAVLLLLAGLASALWAAEGLP